MSGGSGGGSGYGTNNGMTFSADNFSGGPTRQPPQQPPAGGWTPTNGQFQAAQQYGAWTPGGSGVGFGGPLKQPTWAQPGDPGYMTRLMQANPGFDAYANARGDINAIRELNGKMPLANQRAIHDAGLNNAYAQRSDSSAMGGPVNTIGPRQGPGGLRQGGQAGAMANMQRLSQPGTPLTPEQIGQNIAALQSSMATGAFNPRAYEEWLGQQQQALSQATGYPFR